MKLRIKFRKQGDLRFIGHLDIMRYFQKLIRRAGISAFGVSQFSPQQHNGAASSIRIRYISPRWGSPKF